MRSFDQLRQFLPVVFVVPSFLSVTPSVVRHSSSSFASSLLCLSLSSLPGRRDSFRLLFLSFLLCSTELVEGGALHTDEGLFMGLTATLFTWEPEVLDVGVGRPPFLPEEACPLPATILPVFLRTGLTAGLTAVLLGPPGGGGFQSGGGIGLFGEHWCGFFPLKVIVAAGDGDKVGDVAGSGSWGMLL